MGTTAEKLAYLKESKEQIKTALETPSNVMREYSKWIKKYVQNQPTNTVTDGVCTNALDVPLVSMGVDGNSYQGENPSPENPQDIEVIDGVNIWDEEWEVGGYVSNNGTKYDDSLRIRSVNYIEVKANTNYYILASEQLKICFYDNLYGFISYVVKNNVFITTPENCKYVTFSTNLTTYGTIYKNDIAIIKGTAPKPYLPYGHIGLQQSGKNLMNMTRVEPLDTSYNEWNPTVNNGIINCKGVNNESYPQKGTYYNGYVSIYTINYKPSTKYFISCKIDIISNQKNVSTSHFSSLLGGYLQTDLIFNEETGRYEGYVITPASLLEDGKDRRFLEIRLDSCELNISEILVSTEDYTYEPYHEPKLIPIDLQGNSLAKVGDVKVLLKIYRNGDVEIGKNIGENVLDGSDDEEWSNQNGNYDTNERMFFSIKINSIKADVSNRKGICNYFINSEKNVQSNYVDITAFNFHPEAKYSNYIYIKIDKDKLSSQDANGFKQWLSEQYANGTPVIVKYQLAEPETVKLPSIEPITLWEGTNKFELITNLDTTFEMEYVVNKNNILDEIQTAMLEAEIEI